MWLSSAIFSEISGLTDRQARRIFASSQFNGHPINIRSVPCPGGSQKEVWSQSLPAHFQQRLRDLKAEAIAPETLRVDEKGLAEHNWKLAAIRPIIAHPWGSAERRAALRQLVGTATVDWTGRPATFKQSTLELWVRTYEVSGGLHLCLAKKVRKDKGSVRYFIRKEWDSAVPFAPAIRQQIREDLKQYIRGLIKGGAQRKIAMILTGEKLREMTAAYGCNPATLPSQAFKIPLDFYREETHFKAVYRHKHDRKASEDNKPRIVRTIDGLEPMDVVVMDVHHINVRVLRENGTTATPKLIAFHDIATNRVFCEIIMFEEKGGVRNYDVIEAFISMCKHHAFGVPRSLYVDNGSEYRFADDLGDALKLNCRLVGFNGAEDRDRIIRAKPYNAAAKHVEGWFRQMNQQYFRHIQGWVDDDRMNPKRPNLGKLPTAFADGFDAFCDTVYDYLTAYEHMPQKGALKGNSPSAAFRKHVDAGWTATLMDAADLVTIFTAPKPKTVRKHGIEHGRQFWTCDGLLQHFGKTVIAHVPRFHGFSALLITDERGNEIGIAHADRAFEVLDQRGAKESARRSTIRNQALKTLDRSAPNTDVGAELARFGQQQEAVVPNAPDAIISVNRRGNQGLALPAAPAPKGKTRQQEEDETRALWAALNTALPDKSRKVS